MPAPGVQVREFDLAAYLPVDANAIVGVIGPATKGPTNQLSSFTDEGNLVNYHGRPVDGHHAVRAAIRYTRYGNQLRFVRIAGSLLATAYAEQIKTVGSATIPIIRFEAASAGTWANGAVTVNITLNGSPATSFNVYVLFHGTLVERYDNLTNANAETTINNNSSYVRLTIHEDAGTTLPDSTIDSTTSQFVPLVLASGNDGAFASTSSEDSSTGGISAQESWSYSYTGSGAVYTQSEGRAIAPGTLSITDGTETFTDNGDGTLTGSVTGTGVVNYRTGEWMVTFAASPVGAVSVSYNAGTYEVIGSSSATEVTDSGAISRPGVAPGTVAIYDPRLDVLDIGDGTFAGINMSPATKIVPGSLTITTVDIADNQMTVTDDGNGAITGDVAAPGTIDYATGVITFAFNANIKNLQDVLASFRTMVEDDAVGGLSGDKIAGTINYQTGAWTLVYTLTPAGDHTPGRQDASSIMCVFRHCTVIEFGDNIETEFTGNLEEYPVKAGSVQIEYATGTYLTDDGAGNLTGAGGSGTINYQTGAIALDFSSAPASGFAIRAFYSPVIIHCTSKYAGPIGNERSTLTDGLFAWIDKSTSTPASPQAAQWYRFRVMFNNGGGSTAIETFDRLRTMAELIETVNDPSTGSEYVTLEETGVVGVPDIAFDSGAGQKLGMDGAFSNDDVIGAQVGPVFTGLQLFSNPENVPMHFITAPGLYHRQIQLAGINLCESRRCIWIFSIPDLDHTDKGAQFVNGEYNAASVGGTPVPTADVPYPPLAAINSSHAVNAFSWLQYYDQYVDAEVWEPGEAEILALAAKVQNQYEAWFPLAGLRRGQIGNVVSLRYSPTAGERERTYGLVGTRIEVINSFVDFVGQGIYLYGQRTMAREAKATDRLHVRWTANLIANALIVAGRQFVFELNDQILWREIKSAVDDILNPIAVKRGIYDYRIVCDATTNTPEVIQNEKKAICKLFIKFTEAAEIIEFQMIFTPTSADFSEVAPLG